MLMIEIAGGIVLGVVALVLIWIAVLSIANKPKGGW